MQSSESPTTTAVATLIEQRKGARLTSAQAAEYIGVQRGTLEVWRCAGRHPELPYLKVGRIVYYLIEDLDRFIEGCKRGEPVAA